MTFVCFCMHVCSSRCRVARSTGARRHGQDVALALYWNLHHTMMIMTKAHNILNKVNNMNSIEQFHAHSLIMVLNVS